MLSRSDFKHTKTTSRLNCRHGGQFTVLLMVCEQFFEIDITDSISISQKESLIANVFFDSLDSSAGHSMKTSINQSNFPRFCDINGGFMVLEPQVIDYIDNDSTVFEKEPLERLAHEGQHFCAHHDQNSR